MLETEQKVLPEVEIPSREEVDQIKNSAGVYFSAFSLKPFYEVWELNGVPAPAVLLNPRVTGVLVGELMDSEPIDRSLLENGWERIVVNKDLVLNHIERFYEDPMTTYLLNQGWISKEKMNQLNEVKKSTERTRDNFVEINIPYPVSEVVNSYVTASRDPESLVLLGYQRVEQIGTEDEGKLEFLRIEPGVIPPVDILPQLATRYLTVNSPKSLERKNAVEAVQNEVKDYLTEEDLEKIPGFIDPTGYMAYLGEIAKIGKFKTNFRANKFTGIQYLTLLTSVPEKFAETFSPIDLVPEQIVYFTLEGTTIAEMEESNPRQSKFYTMIQSLFDPYEVQYEETRLEFEDKNKRKMFLTNIRKV